MAEENRLRHEETAPLIIQVEKDEAPIQQPAIQYSDTELLVKDYFDNFHPPSLSLELPRCRESEIHVQWTPFLVTCAIPFIGIGLCYGGLTTLDYFASNEFLIRFIPYAGYIILGLCLYIPYIVRCNNVGTNFHRVLEQTFEHRTADAFRFLHSSLTNKLFEAQSYVDRLAYEYKSDVAQAQASISVPSASIPDLSKLQISNITARDMLYESIHVAEIDILQDKYSLGPLGCGCYIHSVDNFLLVMTVGYFIYMAMNIALIAVCLLMVKDSITDVHAPERELNYVASYVLLQLIGLFLLSLPKGQALIISIILKTLSWEATRRIRKVTYETYSYIFIEGVNRTRYEVNDLISRKMPLLRQLLRSQTPMENIGSSVGGAFVKLFK